MKTGHPAPHYYSMIEVLEALQIVSATAKVQDVTSHRLVVLGAIDSFQAGLAGFPERLGKHEVGFKGLWVTVFDQRRFFYGGNARFFGRLRNRGLFLPKEVLNPPFFSVLDGGSAIRLLGASKHFHRCT